MAEPPDQPPPKPPVLGYRGPERVGAGRPRLWSAEAVAAFCNGVMAAVLMGLALSRLGLVSVMAWITVIPASGLALVLGTAALIRDRHHRWPAAVAVALVVGVWLLAAAVAWELVRW